MGCCGESWVLRSSWMNGWPAAAASTCSGASTRTCWLRASAYPLTAMTSAAPRGGRHEDRRATLGLPPAAASVQSPLQHVLPVGRSRSAQARPPSLDAVVGGGRADRPRACAIYPAL